MKQIITGSILLLNILAGLPGFSQQRSYSLKEALKQAAGGNRQLQIKALENQRARLAVQESRSQLLPTVNLSGGYTLYTERPVIYLRNESQEVKLNDVKFGGRHALDGVLNASYPLLAPAVHSGIRTAGIREEMGKQETKILEEQLALGISQIYLGILLNREQLHLLQQSLSRNEKALADSRSLFLQGKSLKTDTLANYIAIQNLQASISSLQNNSSVLKLQMKQLLGLEDSVDLELSDQLEADPGSAHAGSPDLMFSSAMDNRNDISLAALRIEQQKQMKQTVRANYKPQVWAVAQYQLQGQADNLKVWDYRFPRTSFAGLRLQLPIYNGNRQQYQLRQAALSISESEKSLAELKATVRTEVHAASANLNEAHRQLSIQDQNVEAAQINFNMMQERYSHGLGSRLELSDAELALTKAKLNRALAVYQIRISELQLQKATGTISL